MAVTLFLEQVSVNKSKWKKYWSGGLGNSAKMFLSFLR